MLPTICGADLGFPDEPGEYGLDGASFLVNANHVDAWRECPHTVFRTILLTRLGDDALRFAIGAPLDE